MKEQHVPMNDKLLTMAVEGNFCPLPQPVGMIYEDGVVFVEFQGQHFSAFGAMVTELQCTCYPEKGGIVRSCDGEPIGRWLITGSWKVKSWIGSTMHSITVIITIGGTKRTYYGRGFGSGMIFRGKRATHELRKVGGVQ